MPRLDLPLAELWERREQLPEPVGLDAFWERTLAAASDVPLAVRIAPVETVLTSVTTYDVTYAGYGAAPIKAWLHLPAATPVERQLAGVVQFQGYNGGRGLAHEHTFWAQAGFAQLVMDTRGQGSGWTTGETPDPDAGTAGPAQGGFLTRGIESPERHFYRRVFVDAVRAVEVLRGHAQVDARRVAVAGHSQGGGIAIAAAALSPHVAAALPDVPFLSHFRRAVDLTASDPYAEVARYLAAHRDRAEQAFDTLAHVDAAVLGRRAQAPALFSVAMMDSVCLPSTVFAAYHAYAGAKEVEVYEFNDHEGGGPFHAARQVRWLRATLG